jgi:hypothetical protein
LAENNSEVNAAGVTLWIRICDDCKFHQEPPESVKVPGALDSDRVYKVVEIQPGVTVIERDVEIELPRPFNQMMILFEYRCADCELEQDWQVLTVNVGRISVPQFSAPAHTTKSKKPGS